MRRSAWASGLFLGVLLAASVGHARDLGVFLPSIHKGKFTSSLLYEYLKVRDDFDVRGQADFRSQAVGAQFTYGITDLFAVGLKGGVLIDPEQEAQATEWRGRAGYLYGLDLYHDVFPATSVWPGVQVSGGAALFMVPLNRQLNTDGTVDLIDQRLSGVDYHASVILPMKWGPASPYLGMRLFGRSVDWHDNQSATNGGPANIHGKSDDHVGLVVGLPVRITEHLHFQAEAILVTETVITAGFRLVAF